MGVLPMKTPRGLRFWFLALVVLTASFAAENTPVKKAPAKRAIDPGLVAVPAVPGLPRVLLLGDSISIGYTVPVRTRLAGKANVVRPAENCGETARGLKSLDKWLGDGKWDVIHFNFGLHDVKYLDDKGAYVTPEKGKQVASVEEYERNLREIVGRLQKTGAKLVFGTTTPVPAASAGRVEHDEVRYNAAAVRVMKENGVAVDDLHAIAIAHQATIQRPRNVHFTDAGYDELADSVVANVLPLLPAPAK